MDPSTMYLTAFTIIGGIIFLVLFFHYVPFFLWLSAKVSGVNISLVQLFLMRIRNVPPYIFVPGLIEAHKAGLSNITRDELEAHYLAGGHVEKVVHALVSASKANIELPFQMATAIEELCSHPVTGKIIHRTQGHANCMSFGIFTQKYRKTGFPDLERYIHEPLRIAFPMRKPLLFFSC